MARYKDYRLTYLSTETDLKDGSDVHLNAKRVLDRKGLAPAEPIVFMLFRFMSLPEIVNYPDRAQLHLSFLLSIFEYLDFIQPYFFLLTKFFNLCFELAARFVLGGLEAEKAL